MSAAPILKQRGFRSSSPSRLCESPLRTGTLYKETSHFSHIPTYSNSVSSSPSLSMTSSPAVSYPSTPRGSSSSASSPALNDSHRSAPFVPTPASTPLPDSRSCSPYPFARSTTYRESLSSRSRGHALTALSRVASRVSYSSFQGEQPCEV